MNETPWTQQYASYIEENIFYNKNGEVLERKVDSFLLEEIKKDILEDQTISFLDFGCGTGRLLSLFEKKEINIKNYFGYDTSLGMLEKALNKFPNNLFDLDLLQEKFDIVVSLDVLQHQNSLEEIKELANKIVNLAEKKAYLVFWLSNDNYYNKPVTVQKSTFNEHFLTLGQCKFNLFNELKKDFDIKHEVFNEDPYKTCVFIFNRKSIVQ